MTKLYEKLIELQEELMIQNLNAEFEIILSEDTFRRYIEYNMQTILKYTPNLDPNINSFKIGGPGGYITIRKS